MAISGESCRNHRRDLPQYPEEYLQWSGALSLLSSSPRNPFVDFRAVEAKRLAAAMKRDDSLLHPRINRAFSRMPGQVLAQFVYIHPRREAAVGGVILRQGAQFPDLLEQCGNRLGQVVECNGLFCFVHCLQGLRETMASRFVATEKETRLPFWKSGRKVGRIK